VRLLVADQIRGVREAIQIKLLQNHVLPLGQCYVTCV
jgi:hypothetical protein